MKVCTQCNMRYPNEATYCFVDGADLRGLPDPRIGTLLAGRYVIEEVIGEGGMATVYGARHKLTDRPVAIKIMNPMLATDVVVRERFRREAKSAQKLAHPNIIEIYDQGDTEDGTAYIVMERLHGQSLSEIISAGALDVDRALRIMTQCARGIARAHDLEVIHRDLKPENIFIVRREDGSEVVKVLDFGIAKSRNDARLTGQGELFGTPQYMAPERITGADPGAPSDLYALGVVFYEMLTGELPFNAPDIATFFVKHMSEPPRPTREKNPRVPEPLDKLVLSLLAKAPKDRPVDAHRVVHELTEIMRDREIEEPPSTIDEEIPISSDEPSTIANATADAWAKRSSVFEQMLERAYGARTKAPRELTTVLDSVNEIVRKLTAMRSEGLIEQAKLEEIETRGRDGRMQRGHASDALGVDASKAKGVVRELKAQMEVLATQSSLAAKKWADAGREVVRWEGRSAGIEPHTGLSEAYRAAADTVDEWLEVKRGEQRLRTELEAAVQVVADLDFQIRELRAGLALHEQSIESERTQCQRKLETLGNGTAALEEQIMELTSRFTRPLRQMPALEPLFKKLEAGAAA